MLKQMPPEWASSVNYPDGPLIGSPSKIRPTSLAPGGLRPGTGSKAGAEEINYLLASLVAHERANRFGFVQNWQAVSGDNPNIKCAARSPNGFVYVGGDAAGGAYNVFSPMLGAISTETNPSALIDNVQSCCEALNGVIVMAGTTAAGAHGGWRVNVDDTVTNIASNMAADGNGGSQILIYDPVSELCPFVNSNGTDGVSFGYLDPSGTPTIEDATTQPTIVVDCNKPRMATGAGTTLWVNANSLSTQLAAYTTDGGVNWTACAAPFTSSANDKVIGAGYIPDHPTLGAIFIAVTWNSTNLRTDVMYSTSGFSSWSALQTDIGADLAFAAIEDAFLIGHTLFVFPTADSYGSYAFVYDLILGEGFRIGLEYSGVSGSRVVFDGHRFWLDHSTGGILVSSPAGYLPLWATGGDFS